MFPPSFWALRGTPWASLTMPETSRRELSNEVKFGDSTAFFVFIFNEIDYNLGTHDGAARRARAPRRPAGSFDTSCAVAS